MTRTKPYEIVYDTAVSGHVEAIARKNRSLIRDSIRRLLSFEPDREARNRKPLRQPSVLGTAWEIRFGPGNRFRVFYKVQAKHRRVLVLAIGEKTGNKLTIGGQEFEL